MEANGPESPRRPAAGGAAGRDADGAVGGDDGSDYAIVGAVCMKVVDFPLDEFGPTHRC